MIDGAILGVAGFASGIFSTMMPKLSEIRANQEAGSSTAADTRTGEIAASTLIIGVGAISAYFAKDGAPLYLAVLIVVLMVAVYEWTLRANRPFEAA